MAIGIEVKLIRTTINKSKALGYESINVLGYPSYYPKFGFKKSIIWNIKCPFDAPEEAFMLLELKHGSLDNNTGTDIYPQIFYDCV